MQHERDNGDVLIIAIIAFVCGALLATPKSVMLLNARRVFNENGSASAILLAIEDVTRRRETEREKDELLQQKEILVR